MKIKEDCLSPILIGLKTCVAELFSDFGYFVELTKQTRDKGIDIIAIRRSIIPEIDERYLIQYKRHAPHNKVGISVVHELLGVGVSEPHTGLIIATTSSFTKPALEITKKESTKWRLHLKDYFDIYQWLKAYTKKRIW